MSYANGSRVQIPGQSDVYVIDGGYRRLVPPMTISKLYADLNGMYLDPSVANIPLGLPVADGSYLAQAAGTQATYWVETSSRRIIPNSLVMNKWHFNAAAVEQVPATQLLAVGYGPDIA